MPAIAFAVLLLVAWWLRPDELGRWAIYGIVAFTYLTIKLLASFSHSTPEPPPGPLGAVVGAVVPAHNEDPSTLEACVGSLVDQVDRVVIVDDGTIDPNSQAVITHFGSKPNVTVVRFARNRGKRAALRVGTHHLLSTIGPDYIVTVDSDTVSRPNAVAAAVHELRSDPGIGGTTALVRARNWRTNFLTRLQDVRYSNAFLWERAAYSQVGSVLCVCGSFTAWRAEVLAESVVYLTEQRFLGQSCTFGDDRHLTNLALANGWRVTLTETAVADTLVPERFGHFRRQQVRWSKSFFRESLWALRNLERGWAKALTSIEIVTWIVFSLVLLYAILVRPIVEAEVAVVQIALWVSVMSWARSVRFFGSRPEATWLQRAFSFAIAPIYGFIHIFVLLPLRAYALMTLTDTRWGTRAQVEVSSDAGPWAGPSASDERARRNKNHRV